MEENNALSEIEKQGNFEITPIPSMDISVRSDYSKLDTGDLGKMQLGSLISQLPAMMAASSMSKAYFVDFPDGVNGTLMRLKQGGYSTTIVNEKHVIQGSASLREMNSQALALGAFSVMAAVSGQYFLKKINSNIRLMQLEIDKILEFLYGDKKAELLSEMSFVKYAYKNYRAIMISESQKIATIASLQEAKKVAMKDIEFYTNDFDSLTEQKTGMALPDILDKAFLIKDSLELSVQLYMVGSLLEVYYSENYDSDYLSYVEKDILGYVDKLEKHLLGNFAAIMQMIQVNDAKKIKKEVDQKQKKDIFKIVDSLKSSENSESRNFLHEALTVQTRPQKFYVETDGTLYLKTG